MITNNDLNCINTQERYLLIFKDQDRILHVVSDEPIHGYFNIARWLTKNKNFKLPKNGSIEFSETGLYLVPLDDEYYEIVVSKI